LPFRPHIPALIPECKALGKVVLDASVAQWIEQRISNSKRAICRELRLFTNRREAFVYKASALQTVSSSCDALPDFGAGVYNDLYDGSRGNGGLE
jgi:hypothetical protein